MQGTGEDPQSAAAATMSVTRPSQLGPEQGNVFEPMTAAEVSPEVGPPSVADRHSSVHDL